MANETEELELEPMPKSRTGIPFVLFGLVMAAALVPLRVYQVMYRQEAETGFWLVRDEWIYVLYGILAVLCLVPVLSGMILRRRAAVDLGRKLRPVEATFAVLCAAGFIWDAVISFQFASQVWLDYRSGIYIEGFETGATSALQYMVKTGSAAAFLQTLFAACGALLFVQIALINFRIVKRMEVGRLLALMPALWAVCRIIRRFVRTISYIRVPDLFLALLAICFLMIFLLAFAQHISGMNNPGREGRMLGAGIPAAVLLLAIFVPPTVMFLMGRSADLSQDASMELADVGLALFILTFLAGRLLFAPKGYRPDKGNPPSEDTAAPDAAPEAPADTEAPAAAPESEGAPFETYDEDAITEGIAAALSAADNQTPTDTQDITAETE
ncbi:MAG: hypothetical protein LBR73_00125 [Oscillospiraceae bacterium]|nr:hypothetical protein [Oscillospiraceae bacterium]